MEGHGPANVESPVIEPQCRHFRRRRIEKIACVESIVSAVIEGFSVQLPGAGLNHHAHCARRRQAILGTVIRSQSAELGYRFQRREYICSTTAPTISSFAAIN